MRKLPKRARSRTPDRGPALLIKLKPRRVYVLANDLDEERSLRLVAGVVIPFLDLLVPELAE